MLPPFHIPRFSPLPLLCHLLASCKLDFEPTTIRFSRCQSRCSMPTVAARISRAIETETHRKRAHNFHSSELSSIAKKKHRYEIHKARTMATIRKLSDNDVRAIFESLHGTTQPPPHLPFKILRCGPHCQTKSPPSYEYEGKTV